MHNEGWGAFRIFLKDIGCCFHYEKKVSARIGIANVTELPTIWFWCFFPNSMCLICCSGPRYWPARARGLIHGSLRLIPGPIKGAFVGTRHMGCAIREIGSCVDGDSRGKTFCGG